MVLLLFGLGAYCLGLLQEPSTPAALLEGGEVAAVLLPTGMPLGGTSPLQESSSLAPFTRTHWAQVRQMPSQTDVFITDGPKIYWEKRNLREECEQHEPVQSRGT